MNKPLCLGLAQGIATALLGLALLVLAGCATSGKTYSAAVTAAQRHNLKGVAAANKQDPQRALREFNKAYRLYASIEDHPGCVTVLVNKSRLNRRQGDLTAAASSIDKALIIAKGEHLEEVAFEKSLILLAERQLPEAFLWATRSLNLARPQTRGRDLNLLGRIELARGNIPESHLFAEQAIKSQPSTASIELANSNRLLGEIFLAKNKPAKATDFFEHALQMDKEAGLSQKIVSDLEGLSRAALMQKNSKSSLLYLRRALTACSNAGEQKRSTRLVKQIEALCQDKEDLQCEINIQTRQ